MRREVPLLVGGLTGFLFVVEYFFNVPFLSETAKAVQSWVVVISAFMMGLGAINLLRIHSRNLVNPRRTSKLNSVLMLGSLLCMSFTGIVLGQDSPFFKTLFSSVYEPLGATAFATLMFYAATVVFRSFRFRNLATTLFMASAALVIFGRSPLGEALVPVAKTLADWIFKIPNLAGQRGIMIGSAIGAVSVSLRVILGVDRKYLGE
ncbi:MAG: hypothetical protein ACOX5M_00655 [Bacillota bacterium]